MAYYTKEFFMVLVYVLTGLLAFLALIFFLIIKHTTRLFILAGKDVYRSMSNDLILEEGIVEQIRNSKSVHVQRYLDALFPRLFCIFGMHDEEGIQEMNEDETIMRGELALSLLAMMEKRGQIKRQEETYTREEFKARMFLLSDLHESAREWYMAFINDNLENEENPEEEVDFVEVIFVSKIASYKGFMR
jgi:hypothetical protein